MEPARIVKAGRMDRDQVRHGGERQVNRRSADRAEGMDLLVAAVPRDAPLRRRAGDLHIRPRWERQIGSVAGTASQLAIAALAVVFEDGLRLRFVPDRAARASAGIGSAHLLGSLLQVQERLSARWRSDGSDKPDGILGVSLIATP